MKEPKEDDRKIGQRIRIARIAVGMSQEKLGEALGLTFQQVQKYEKGTNRVGGSRLIQIASILKTTVGLLAGENPAATPESDDALAALATPVGQRMVEDFNRLSPANRALVADIAKALATALEIR